MLRLELPRSTGHTIAKVMGDIKEDIGILLNINIDPKAEERVVGLVKDYFQLRRLAMANGDKFDAVLVSASDLEANITTIETSSGKFYFTKTED